MAELVKVEWDEVKSNKGFTGFEITNWVCFMSEDMLKEAKEKMLKFIEEDTK
jgi:hypothetical protein